MIQAIILILGGAAIWLISRREKWMRWGYIIGLISQPFFMYATYQEKQWGIFALAIWYSYSYSQGIYNYWIRKEKDGNSTKNLFKNRERIFK